MLTPKEEDFLRRAWLAACKAEHIWPEMAACEAALESGFGQSHLAIQDFNLFGMKQHVHPIFGTHALPTREDLGGQWVTVTANWITYPDWQSCFVDRMSTLRRLAPKFPHYQEALDAKTGGDYVRAVSQTWSTDPLRAEKVIAIFNAISGDWSAIAT